MQTFTTLPPLQAYLATQKTTRQVGFVPTMGALHDGHLSLVKAAKESGKLVVASIFVNPTQFNEASDLDKYPRQPEADQALLETAGCDVLFLPDVATVYPPDLDTTLELDFGSLDKVMEGAHRPGHFDGVAQVVKRLLDIVKPDSLFMGQKDYQQVAIVRSMLKQLQVDVELVMVPTVREITGLAMSSRNQRLSDKGKIAATVIHHTLNWVKTEIFNHSISDLEAQALKKITHGGLQPEYFTIADAETLQPVTIAGLRPLVACTAAWLEDVRLIDNIIIELESDVQLLD